ncbi:unnamed protein product [Allacma fusca]|uniref:F-box domain-containing protein n=1 Tax=Allacma fusca TaxID=39272 RepID=A0A8J2KIX1_9HEXA|nr:unnamed protein product [Allacma fusca]
MQLRYTHANDTAIIMEYLAMKVGEEEKLERTEYLLKSLAEHGSFKDVLKQVFKHLDFKRLKMSRLVSKRWNEEACRILRKRCIFSVKSRSRDDGGPAELFELGQFTLPTRRLLCFLFCKHMQEL